MNRGLRAEPTPPECAVAVEMFDHLCAAGTMKQILGLHREICTTLNMKPNKLPDFYPKLKAKLSSSWKAQALFKKFDARANHKVYAKGRACAQTKVLIIGAGPCGLRAAIECQLLGAKVVVIEKRDRISRNNVLHLWPFVIQDLRALGAKKFFGKFCAGSIDHISIRQLQCILLKVALLLGVECHEGVSFEELLEPTVTDNNETLGWRARVLPENHPVAQYEFDALLGADGKRNTLHGFKRKEFRGKLAMAITANFINRHTEQEASVAEISGVAFIFNQKFFKDLYEETGIDLENIVYYKDDTHYFVMTAKKHSLLDKGVLLNDFPDVSRLLHVENVDRSALMRYAQEAARFSTEGKLPLKDFALNHYGEPDVALFDFTSMYAAENASMVTERLGRRLLCELVGDSLLEPFWPTGSGCARGFLSALDAAWAVRAWGQNPHPLDVIAERESVYRLLAQTTPENLNRDFGGYTLDPGTRYPNLNRTAVSPHRVTSFYVSDDPLPLDATASTRKRRRELELPEEVLVCWLGVGEGGLRGAAAAPALAALLRRYRPDLMPDDTPDRTVYQVLQHEFGIPTPSGSIADVPEPKLRSFLTRIYAAFKGEVPHVIHQTDVFDQIKLSQQKEKRPIIADISVYTNAADNEKSRESQSYRKKRRSVRPPVSSETEDYIRKQIGRLNLDDITHLARLIEGHDTADVDAHSHKQRALQDEILALLDPEDSPDPAALRQSLAQLLHGTSKRNKKTEAPRVKRELPQRPNDLEHFFQEKERAPVRPPRKLKGLDATSLKFPDLSDVFDEPALDVAPEPSTKKKELLKSLSLDEPNSVKQPSELIAAGRRSLTPEPKAHYARRDTIAEIVGTSKKIFEDNKRKHTPSPKASPRRGSATLEKALRWQQMTDSQGQGSRGVERRESDASPNPDMALRRQRMVELIDGFRPRRSPNPATPKRKTSDEMSFMMQRASDMMQKSSAKKRSGGRRKAAREIMRQRFEKSIQMLAAEPQLALTSSADLENDYGLQQYRASAPQFGDRVKKLEKKLQHYEEGRVVGAGSRDAAGGARVARLAAELAGTNASSAAHSRSSKPKDLMRSVGKIERDDWNVKEIERKIQENRMGRPEPRTAEKVPKWDREQFLGRQRRLKEGDNEERWGQIDETIHKVDQKLRDSGRPDLGTKKVANLANKFVKKEPEPLKPSKEDSKKWRGPSTAGMQCAACGTRVFAAESVTADGLHLHRACFRCAVCKAVLRPGNYTMERYGSRLVCLRHSGVSVPDAVAAMTALANKAGNAPAHTPERISLEASDSCAREIDEDEWTDRNFLASETSGAGGLSDEDSSSSEEYIDADDSEGEDEAQADDQRQPALPRSLYFSDDSFGYDDYSDDGGESSGNESCSRMREAREARRREVPADAQPPTDSDEAESEDETESSDEDSISSATEVSTDSEFAREECAPAHSPPAILVTEPPPPPAPPAPDYPLSRTRSAGGLATKMALELKRKYLLGEPSPPAVRKSDSTSQLDTKLEAFRTNITEFQKMLHPATLPPRPVLAFQLSTDYKKPMPDIIKNLCDDAPVDLLSKVEVKKDRKEDTIEEKKESGDSDSLSDSSSSTKTGPNQLVPRLEVHDEGGELIQLDSLTIVTSTEDDKDDDKPSTVTGGTGTTVLAVDSESSESCRDATTLALTETELSDWAAESVMDDCALDDRDANTRKNPRTLSGPKTVHDAKNISAISSHVCGRTSPIKYSNAVDHFEFADEGEQDPSLETPIKMSNFGYMEIVEQDYDTPLSPSLDRHSPVNDRSMNFIERSFSETMIKPSNLDLEIVNDIRKPIDEMVKSTDSEKTITNTIPQTELRSPQMLISLESPETEKPIAKEKTPDASPVKNKIQKEIISIPPPVIKKVEKVEPLRSTESINEPLSDLSAPLVGTPTTAGLAVRAPGPFRLAMSRSASDNFRGERAAQTGTVSSPRPSPAKVQEIQREREEQTDIVRRLVLERLGNGPRKSCKKVRALPVTSARPPSPPRSPPPRPASPLAVAPSLSDPELGRERRGKSIIRSLSSYINRRRRVGPRSKERTPSLSSAHKSTSSLERAPPVPPPPAGYVPPRPASVNPSNPADVDERDAMQLWFEARWARLVAQRRAREPEPDRRLARLERKLSRPLSAEVQAATVAELVQVSAQRDAHQALLAADRRRSAASGSIGG